MQRSGMTRMDIDVIMQANPTLHEMNFELILLRCQRKIICPTFLFVYYKNHYVPLIYSLTGFL